MERLHFSLVIALSIFMTTGGPAAAGGRSDNGHAALELIATFDSGVGEGTEVVSAQADSARVALTNSETGTITILDLDDPAEPEAELIVDLGLGDNEGVTSVAFHPDDDYFLVTIEVEGTTENGRIEIYDADDGELLNVLAAGSEPDAVAIDRRGRFAVVSNEAESFSFDPVSRQFDSPAGSVTIVDLRDGPEAATARLVALTDASAEVGFVNSSSLARAASGDKRLLEREVDLDGNGVIDAPADLNNDGDMTDEDVLIGWIDRVEVRGNEEDGEVLLIPLVSNAPKFLEPELAAFSRNGKRAFVVLQENNGVAVIDVENGTLLRYHGLGITEHFADIHEDGDVVFRDWLVALREPDGIAMTPDGRYFVTADEGDTDPKASKTDMPAFPTAGGRTISVFDSASGTFVGDTANQIDEAANNAGVYPDGRSDSKGSEPENLATFRYRGVTYAAVGLERANAVALVSLAEPANPTVVHVAVVSPGEAPEGIAHFEHPDGGDFVIAANEGSGTVSIFEVVPFAMRWAARD